MPCQGIGRGFEPRRLRKMKEAIFTVLNSDRTKSSDIYDTKTWQIVGRIEEVGPEVMAKMPKLVKKASFFSHLVHGINRLLNFSENI